MQLRLAVSFGPIDGERVLTRMSRPGTLAGMDRARGPAPAFRRAGWLALITGYMVFTGLTLAGCHTTSAASPATPARGTASASASPGLSLPGTHQATTRYQITPTVSTVVVVSHVGNVSVTGGSASAISVTQRVYYSKTPPVTTRTVRGKTLTVTYSCPAQIVCGVAYTLAVPRSVAVQVTAGAGAIRLAGLAGTVTAKADVGLINATGLTGASVSLATRVGGISASFAAAPATVQASARVGAITLHVPGTAAYKVAANAHVGKATVSTRQSSSSAYVITATTDVGAILVAPS